MPYVFICYRYCSYPPVLLATTILERLLHNLPGGLWVALPVKWVIELWCDWFSVILVSSNKTGRFWQKEENFSGLKTLHPPELGEKYPSNWARSHEEVVGSLAGASVGPGLLWVWVVLECSWGEREGELTQSAQMVLHPPGCFLK